MPAPPIDTRALEAQMSPQTTTTPYAEQFWSLVEQHGPDECWPWQGSPGPHGYGHARTMPDGTRRAHRVAWLLTYGAIPAALHVLHHCDNPPCCNPRHLWVGTHAQNVADMVQKGRHQPGHRKGELHHRAKLTDTLVRAIRMQAAEGISDQAVAAQYGVSQATVRDIRLGFSWKHVQ